MPDKRFHNTPDGPVRCRSKFRSCSHTNHYVTEESARVAQRILDQDSAKQIKLEDLRTLIRNPSNHELNRSGFLFQNRYDAPRRFSEDLEKLDKSHGIKPFLYHSTGHWKLDHANEGQHPVEVQITRTDSIDESAVKIFGKWRMTTRTTLGYYQNYEKISHEIEFVCDDEGLLHESFARVHEAFRTAVVMSGESDDETITSRVDKMFAEFKTMFNAIESNALGDFELWELGYGYFQDSDGEVIVVNEEFNTSAFRGENFKSFLADNRYYRKYTPIADITINDTSRRTGATWTLQTITAGWRVTEVNSSGETKISDCVTAQDVYDAIYWAVLDDDADGEDDVAKRKAQYCGELAWKIDDALAKHTETVDERIDLERTEQKM